MEGREGPGDPSLGARLSRPGGPAGESALGSEGRRELGARSRPPAEKVGPGAGPSGGEAAARRGGGDGGGGPAGRRRAWSPGAGARPSEPRAGRARRGPGRARGSSAAGCVRGEAGGGSGGGGLPPSPRLLLCLRGPQSPRGYPPCVSAPRGLRAAGAAAGGPARAQRTPHSPGALPAGACDPVRPLGLGVGGQDTPPDGLGGRGSETHGGNWLPRSC